MNFFKCIPMESCFRRPKCHFRPNKLLHDYWVLVSHTIPAYITDLGLWLIGRKPFLVNTYNKMNKLFNALNFFGHNEWIWTHKNVDAMRDTLSPEDAKVSDEPGFHPASRQSKK